MPQEAPTLQDWTIPDVPEQPPRLLLYSESFVLQSLQGCWGDPEQVRRTGGWLALAALLRCGLAVAQLIVMALSRVPLLHIALGAAARHSGRNVVGFFLRGAYWKARLKSLGEDTLIDQGVDIWGADRVSIGHRCIISSYVQLSAGGSTGESGIEIGDHVFIGPFSILGGSSRLTIGRCAALSASARVYTATNLPFDMRRPEMLLSMAHAAPRETQHVVQGPVRIGDFALVGIGAILLLNVSLGIGAMVHPYAEVTTSFGDFANVTGHGRARHNGWRRPFRRSREATRAA